ncbi:MAG: pyrroline-5-carboxylate reductase [Gammaproteobacteria bacterium]|nr:pyrroline-5-carboxylate reductase [Gammaproteobacteria bacterium]
MRIAFIGGGNMATALISSLFASRHDVDRIKVADPNIRVKERLQRQWPVTCYEQAADAIEDMDAIVLAVKPQVLPIVLDDIGDLVSGKQLVISIVAGIHTSQIAEKIKSNPPIIRTMPNTPALIGLGITGMYARVNCSLAQRELTHNLMESAGEVVWLEKESLLDVVTAVSGSGPAYFYYLVECLRKAGTRLGLPEDVAASLALHTAHGASAMAVKSDTDVTVLRQRVTTPGGTTEAAMEQLSAGDFEQLIDAAITAATNRGLQLARSAQA